MMGKTLTARQIRKIHRDAEIYEMYLKLQKENPLAHRLPLIKIMEERLRNKYDLCIETIYLIIKRQEAKKAV